MQDQKIRVLQLALRNMIEVAETLEYQAKDVDVRFYSMISDAKHALELSLLTPEDYVAKLKVELKEEREIQKWLA